MEVLSDSVSPSSLYEFGHALHKLLMQNCIKGFVVL